MVFAYHCLEGYLNYIGEKITPEAWKEEKTLFSKTGLYGKLDTICKLCGIPTPVRGRRPYSTVHALKNLRDDMAHPKIRKLRNSTTFKAGHPPPLFPPSYLSTQVSHEKALRARDDVKRIADDIQKAANGHHPGLFLDSSALEGIESMRSTSTRVVI